MPFTKDHPIYKGSEKGWFKKGEKSVRYKGLVNFICPICHKQFDVRKSYFDFRRKQSKKCLFYCSKKCRYEGITGKMSKAANWKGGRIRRNTTTGIYWYIKSPNHPNGGKQKYVPEHVLVIEQSIGRYLIKGEVVHHINRDKLDNRLENLQLLNRRTHAKLHVGALLKWRGLKD